MTASATSLRSFRERAAMTLLFEAGGLALVSPAYAVLAGQGAAESMTLLVVLALCAILGSPLHNALWDRLDLRLAGRVVSDRPQGLRLVHALSHELSLTAVTLPAVMVLGGHTLAEALLVEAGLTAAYTLWAYVFNLLWDRMRPLSTAAVPVTA